MGFFARLIIAFSALTATWQGGSPAAAADESNAYHALRRSVVAIQTGYGVGVQPTGGTGVVVANVGTTSFVLTARHVLYPSNIDPYKVDTSTFKREVTIYSDDALSFPSRDAVIVKEDRSVQPLDIALLKVVGAPLLPPACLLMSAPLTTVTSTLYFVPSLVIKNRHTVNYDDGKLINSDPAANLLEFRPEIDGGYSGGPVAATDSGFVVGMGLRTSGSHSEGVPAETLLSFLSDYPSLQKAVKTRTDPAARLDGCGTL